MTCGRRAGRLANVFSIITLSKRARKPRRHLALEESVRRGDGFSVHSGHDYRRTRALPIATHSRVGLTRFPNQGELSVAHGLTGCEPNAAIRR